MRARGERRGPAQHFRELRSIVAQSAPAERVVVANVQLFGLDE